MERKIKPAYRVELDRKGCPKCKAGRTWAVTGPDGEGGEIQEATFYGDRDEAEYVCRRMNDAFQKGRSAGSIPKGR